MYRFNSIQNAILQLDGGTYQKLLDAYFYRKYNFDNIQPLGVQTGTNKVTKGTPDSFVKHKDGSYTLIMYGTVESNPFNKLKEDILSCFNPSKLEIEKEKIKKLLCGYTSTNIHIEQIEQLENLVENVEIEMVGLGTISQDIDIHYPLLAKEYLGISMDSDQIFSPKDFIAKYDKNGMNAPLDIDFKFRTNEVDEIKKSIDENDFTLITGQPGVGKTKIAIEICTAYENHGYEVLCIKNNDLFLYDDIKYYLSESKDYLLFIDDINQTTNLNAVLTYIVEQPEDKNIKILATIREYAISHIQEVVRNYYRAYEIEISPLKKEEVEKILVEDFSIRNHHFLSRISEVSEGNPRLAILAAKYALKNGYTAMTDASDIYINYYGHILKESQLEEKDIHVLFSISVCGPTQLHKDNFLTELIKFFNVSESDFINICRKLEERELIDLYFDEAVNVSDQSLSNYLIYHVMLEKRFINISSFLDIGFPVYKRKVMHALNTLSTLFYSEKSEEYIHQEIIQSWKNTDESNKIDYLRSFFIIAPEESLAKIHHNIIKMDEDEIIDIECEFEKSKSKNFITNLEVEILSSFKYTDYYIESIQLLLLLLTKQRKLVPEIFTAFSKKMSFDIYSDNNNYKKEYELIETIWSEYKTSKNRDILFILVEILNSMLHSQFSKIESGKNSKSFEMITVHLAYGEGLKKLRFLIWSILSELYEENLYTLKIESILKGFYWKELEEKEFELIFSYDMCCFKNLFLNKWQDLSINQCKILYSYVKIAHRKNIEIDESFEKYKQNKDFEIYLKFSKDYHSKYSSLEAEDKKIKSKLSNLIIGYSIKDYNTLFRTLKVIEDENDRRDMSIGRGVGLLFSLLEESKEEAFIEIIKEYIKSGSPFSGININIIMKYLLKKISVEDTLNIIRNYSKDSQRLWESVLWDSLTENMVTTKWAEEYLEFFIDEVKEDSPKISHVLHLENYIKVDPTIAIKFSKIIIEANLENDNVINQYIGVHGSADFIDRLINLFKDNLEILEQLYLIGASSNIDYNGLLLERLIQENPKFWETYTRYLSQYTSYITLEMIDFKQIWEKEDYAKYINVGYENLIIDTNQYYDDHMISLFFPNTADTNQKVWLNDYLKRHYENGELIRKVFNIIVTRFPSEKISFFINITKLNRDLSLFKSLPLTPMSYSWSGSLVPQLENELNFIIDLKAKLQGIDYIDHRVYLNERENQLKERIKKEQVKEYLEEL